jgi:hypothetical protein
MTTGRARVVAVLDGRAPTAVTRRGARPHGGRTSNGSSPHTCRIGTRTTNPRALEYAFRMTASRQSDVLGLLREAY